MWSDYFSRSDSLSLDIGLVDTIGCRGGNLWPLLPNDLYLIGLVAPSCLLQRMKIGCYFECNRGCSPVLGKLSFLKIERFQRACLKLVNTIVASVVVVVVVTGVELLAGAPKLGKKKTWD